MTSGQHARQVPRWASAIALGLASGLVLTSCSAARTPETFCGVMDKHKVRYEEAMAAATKKVGGQDLAGMLGGLTEAISALGDLQVMWEDLVDAAPDDIQKDVIVIRDTNKKQMESVQDATSDPLSALGSAFAGSLTAAGSYQRVNAYAAQHCGAAPFVNPKK